jgi:hypothetical protein
MGDATTSTAHICRELSKVLLEVRAVKQGVDRLLQLHEPPPSLHPEPVTQVKATAWWEGRDPTWSEDVNRWKSISADDGVGSSSAHVSCINQSTQSLIEWDSPPPSGSARGYSIDLTATTIIAATPTTPLCDQSQDLDSAGRVHPFSIPESPESDSQNNSTVTTSDNTPEALDDAGAGTAAAVASHSAAAIAVVVGATSTSTATDAERAPKNRGFGTKGSATKGTPRHSASKSLPPISPAKADVKGRPAVSTRSRAHTLTQAKDLR